jgi:1-deoxy-D-xylulose-5-phosphate reductoisomerase
LTAHTNEQLLAEQCARFQPQFAVMSDPEAAEGLRRNLPHDRSTEILSGPAGLVQVSANPRVDTVMAAIVGGVGLPPTLAAVEAGKKVLLANKESLVMAGGLFMAAVKASGATLLPIDSEHNAIFQCLPTNGSHLEANQGVRRLLLTGSGGPFLDCPLQQLQTVTPEQACRHPNWTMGRKISVDSATMMNKGLELIEACHLFGLGPDKIEVVIHPQSVVHSMVDYVDGSVLAQLGNPDMRTPIAHALAWPERMDSGVAPLDIVRQGRLDFLPPDLQRFPCLALAMAAAKVGCGAQIALNAANEVAVEAFLSETIGFLDIAILIKQVVNGRVWAEPERLEQVHELDQIARAEASELCAAIAKQRSR